VQFILLAIIGLFNYSNDNVDFSYGSGPELFLLFNGSIKDESGNEHKVFSKGCKMAPDRFGRENGSIYLDGKDDHLAIPDDGSLSFKKLSIAFWFKTTSDRLQNLIGKEDFHSAEAAVYQMFINWEKYPGIGFNIVNGDMPCTYPNNLTSSYTNTNLPVPLNKWHFVVATWNGKVQSLYVDGELVDTNKLSMFDLRQCYSEIRIGVWYQNTLPFVGYIDDVMIFRRALSAKQIQRLAKR
jgi:hypothetical protein